MQWSRQQIQHLNRALNENPEKFLKDNKELISEMSENNKKVGIGYYFTQGKDQTRLTANSCPINFADDSSIIGYFKKAINAKDFISIPSASYEDLVITIRADQLDLI